MRVEGYWHRFSDGGVRPVIDAQVQGADGGLIPVMLLLDSGADRTVLSARYAPVLAAITELVPEALRLEGIGGSAETFFVSTLLRFRRQGGPDITIRGTFAVFSDPLASDISVLGRDVTDNFSVSYSQPENEVLLLAPPHRYTVSPAT